MVIRNTIARSNVLTLTTVGVVLAVGTLSYLCPTSGVAPKFWDMFVLAFIERLVTPAYKKVAPTKYRGTLESLCQIGTCTGIIASLFLGIFSDNDPHWWSIMLYIASVPGFILALGMQFAVESPRWLCKVGPILGLFLKLNISNNINHKVLKKRAHLFNQAYK